MQQTLARFTFPKHRRERFEHENICISHTFQETVGRHLKPSLTVVSMATLNQINSKHFLISINNIPIVKISRHIIRQTYSTVALTPFSFLCN